MVSGTYHTLMYKELKEINPSANPERALFLANSLISKSKEQYGFIGNHWKPLVVTDYWIYEKKKMAIESINKNSQ